MATADGVVAERREDSQFGRWVILRHKDGLETLYGHMQRFGAVEAGQKVRRGQVIGYVGRSGRATAPHVHYGVRQNGRWVNPLPYILERDDLSARPAFATRK
jgi:murein DD-endopeptidase MepM/ murein hydrolase activator NlpD